VLYVPNEAGDSRQSATRRALKNLLDAGLIGDVAIFSLLHRIRAGMPTDEAHAKMLGIATAFRPDVILMQHLGGTRITRRVLAQLKATGTGTRLIYHEADPYSRFRHPLPHEARIASRAADVTFTVGSGNFKRNFDRAGATDVRWLPSGFDAGRFGTEPIDDSVSRPFDVVMVANRATPRLRGHPNWRDRIRFVEFLSEEFQDRFAVYGRGWDGPSAKGTVPYDQQGRAIQSAWISANWDHYVDEPDYFSDRLPTSLAAGSIHVTSSHPGYGAQFGHRVSSFIRPVNSFEEAAAHIHQILELPPAELIAAQRAGRDFAFAKFRQEDQLVTMLNFAAEIINPEAAQEAWDSSKPGLRGL
jgi:hypothetical protein